MIMVSASEKHPHVRKIVEKINQGNLEDARKELAWAKSKNQISEDDFLSLEGIILAIEKKYEDAIEKMIQIKKKDANILAALGYCYLHLNDLDKALDLFVEATNADKTHAIAWYNLAVVHHKRGELQEAETSLQTAEILLELDKNRWMSHEQRLLTFPSRVADLKASLERVIPATIDESNPMFWYRLSLIFQERQLYGEALNAAWKAINLRPNDPVLWAQLGRIQFLLEYFAEAEKSLKKSIKLDKHNAAAWFFLAESYRSQNQFRKAINALETLVKMGFKLPSVFMSMIELALALNDIHLAEKFCDMFLSCHAENEHGQYLKALVQVKKGNARDAVAILENLSRKYPESLHVKTQLGNVYRMLGEIDTARRVLQEIHSRHPRYLPGILNLALLSRDAGNLNEAISYYEKIVELRPTMAAAWNDLGILLEKTGQREKAKEAFREAIQRGKSPQFRFNLGKVLFDEGNIDEAILLLEEAARMDEKYYKPRLYLICCYQKKNDLERVNELVGQLRRINPDLLRQLPCNVVVALKT